MFRIGRRKIRRSQVRRTVWIAITAIAAVAMVVGTVGPAFN
jgi:hypothetical protein